MRWISAVTIGLACLTSSTQAQLHSERLKTVSEGRYWHLLLHYKKNFFGSGYTSEADGPEFFLDPDGKSDPYKELLSTIDSFKSERKIGNLKQHPQCAFPERFRYLSAELGLNIPKQKCSEFHAWKNRFQPVSATLVFASAHLNNPASMFGHTLLRVDSKPPANSSKQNDLLNYGVNYGANTGDDGGLLFAVYGLTGGYKGFFSLLPYFEKVKEYSAVDSRDLWEYTLNLNNEQIDRMLNHLWELGTTYFKYYFFNKNCAYHLLSVLEVANPEWHFTDKFFYWVIPSDTVRVLTKVPDSVRSIRVRPSVRRDLNQKLIAMDGAERAEFSKRKDSPDALTSKESDLMLDALLDYQRYKIYQSSREYNEEEKSVQRRLLIARAKTKTLHEDTVVADPINRPDLGHLSSKLGMYGGVKKAAGYLGLNFRPAYQDLLDQDLGYERYSELIIGQINLRYIIPEHRFRLHQADFAKITSFSPFDLLQKRMSWNLDFGTSSPADIECKDCTALRARGGVGIAKYLSPKSENHLIYGFANANIEYSGWFKNSVRAGPSLRVGVLNGVSRFLKFEVSSETFYFPNQTSDDQLYNQTQLVQGWLINQSFELRLSTSYYIKRHTSFFDNMGTLSWYF